MLEFPRSSGILLHPSSLPGRFGMGEIGPEAERWLDYLQRMGQRVWVMPLMESEDASGEDPLLLSFDALRNDGVLLPTDLAMLPAFNDERISLGAVSEVRHAFLQLAARRFLHQIDASPLLAHAFERFCEEEAVWLDDWALHAALQHAHERHPWFEWPKDLATRQCEAITEAMVGYAAEIEEHKVLQFLHARHWQRLRARAHDMGVTLVGTVAAFLRRESAMVWAMPHLFALDSEVKSYVDEGMTVPCLAYRWKAHVEENFDWWQLRWARALRRFDGIKIEHGEGLSAVWETDLNGLHGCWVHGPGSTQLALPTNFLTNCDRARCLTSLSELEACPTALAVFDWQSLLTAHTREQNSWRFTWDQVTSELQNQVRDEVAKTGRL